MKKVYPSQTQNFTSVPQLDDNHRTDGTTVQRFHQSTFSKGPLSIVPSEVNQSYYQIIERNKMHYLESNRQFNEMRFMEQMASLKSRSHKQQLLENFMSLYDEMVQCLLIIQSTIFQINFEALDFQAVYEIPATTMVDILFKDVKTLEGIHNELIYSSPLRYMETVLEALSMNLEYYERLKQIEIKSWSQKCLGHLSQCKMVQQRNKNSKLSSICCCFYK